MKWDDIDWKSGRVVYWDLDSVNPERLTIDQIFELKEDLAQVSFPGNVLIDVGWYPEFSRDGAFLVAVAKDENWDKPLFEERSASIPGLLSLLERAIAKAQQG